jgi:hypothetical protein
MSTPLKAIIIFAAVQIYAFSMSAQGVIANDAAILPLSGSGQYLTLTNSVNPSQGRYGLFAIQISSGGGSQFTFSYAGIAEEYALYAVTPGTVIDPSFAALTIPLVSNNGVDPGSSVQTFALGQSSYFGYWDDRQLFGIDPGIQGTPDIYDNYGWVLLTRTAAGLQVSSSATALGGGIIAGTFTQVPEPSVSVLVLLGLGLALALRRFAFCYANPPNMEIGHIFPTTVFRPPAPLR